MNNDTYSLYEIQIDYLTNKINNVLDQLKTLEPNRVKRGLVDGLGSIIKSISGNLDQTDALKYNEAIRILQGNQDKIVSEFNDHISLSKEWMDNHNNILEQLVENQGRINATMELILKSDAAREDSLVKYAKLAQLLVITSENVEDLVQEVLRLENSLAFIHASSMHHTMIDITTLEEMVAKLKNIYGKDQVISLQVREYYEIIKPAYYFSERQIVFVFKFPIISKVNFELYKLAIVPNKNSQALIPPFPFIATTPNSFLYIEAECPKVSTWYLCEKDVAHQIRTKPDCIHGLINDQTIQDSCKFIKITLMREAMEKLDDKHYVLSFPHQTNIQLRCNRRDYTSLLGSYLITVPVGCQLKTEEFTIINSKDEIKGQPLKLMRIPEFKNTQTSVSHLNLSSISLEKLHNLQDKIILQAPVQLDGARPDPLYHTTIPFYTIMAVVSILSIIVILRRYAVKRKPKEVQQHSSRLKMETPDDVPATFSLQVLQ
ncbi:uncharacterized protein [Maniola hyperantus]|uniref:uncharacterized protein n=1 Tax=Aphantopus hyperantus TaxID=2795564 RepID=UPI003749A51E